MAGPPRQEPSQPTVRNQCSTEQVYSRIPLHLLLKPLILPFRSFILFIAHSLHQSRYERHLYLQGTAIRPLWPGCRGLVWVAGYITSLSLYSLAMTHLAVWWGRLESGYPLTQDVEFTYRYNIHLFLLPVMRVCPIPFYNSHETIILMCTGFLLHSHWYTAHKVPWYSDGNADTPSQPDAGLTLTSYLSVCHPLCR